MPPRTTFSIEAKGITKVLNNLGNPQAVGPPMRRFFTRSTATVHQNVIKNLRRYSDTGASIASVRSQVDQRTIPLWGRVFSKLFYVRMLETGTRPHFPRIEGRFARWAARRGVNPYVVAQAIAARGTRRRRPFARAFFRSRKQIFAFADEAAVQIVRRLRGGV